MAAEHRDLCSVCAHASTCVSRSKRAQPVFECERYAPPRRAHRARLDHHLATSHATEADCSQFQGLCSDCENRWHCALRVPEGGVWRCEEYR